MIIQFPRGDSYERGFVLKNKNTDEPMAGPFDEIYFTVKKRWSGAECQLQKRMSEGGITDDGNGHFTLYIAPEDTDEMDFGEYDCDIEFVKEGFKKTFPGKFILDKEVTHLINE